MELSTEIDTQLSKGLSGAKVNVQMMYVVFYRRPVATSDEIFTGLCDISLYSYQGLGGVESEDDQLHHPRSLGCTPPSCWANPPVYSRMGYAVIEALVMNLPALPQRAELSRSSVLVPIGGQMYFKLRRGSAHHLLRLGGTELQMQDYS